MILAQSISAQVCTFNITYTSIIHSDKYGAGKGLYYNSVCYTIKIPEELINFVKRKV